MLCEVSCPSGRIIWRISTLRKTDPTEANLTSFFKQEYRPLSRYKNIRGLAKGVDFVLLILCGGYPIIVVVGPAASACPQWPLHLILQFLQHQHEFRIRLGDPSSTSSGHLIGEEIGGDHVSHEHSSNMNKCSA